MKAELLNSKAVVSFPALTIALTRWRFRTVVCSDHWFAHHTWMTLIGKVMCTSHFFHVSFSVPARIHLFNSEAATPPFLSPMANSLPGKNWRWLGAEQCSYTRAGSLKRGHTIANSCRYGGITHCAGFSAMFCRRHRLRWRQ